MSRSKYMRWLDRLKRVEYPMWEWYQWRRIEYRNKPEKVKIIDDWMRDCRRPG